MYKLDLQIRDGVGRRSTVLKILFFNQFPAHCIAVNASASKRVARDGQMDSSFGFSFSLDVSYCAADPRVCCARALNL